MPIWEYKCSAGHITEKLVLPRPGQPHSDTITCSQCKRNAFQIFSKTGAPNLKEESGGFYKPSKE